ncbi:hypothetical protein NVP1121O_052 [Vibrio phage 1.121.O._10N.286.46.C4]|nr:hypothetical protein NVP1121O_052 [Vibrio phage 1.121.O._10N.286.46.C4]
MSLFRLSKQPPVIKEINGTKYKLVKWSSYSTTLEGMKIGKILAPTITMMGELLNSKTSFQGELEEIYTDPSDNVFAMTGAIHQLIAAIGDEHFMDLQDKLLSGLSVHDPEKDEYVVIDAWYEHLDNPAYSSDWEELLVWSIKENLINFFMNQSTFQSAIGMFSKIANPLLEKLQSQIPQDTNK